MHNPVYVQENEAHILLWDIDIHTDQKTRPNNNQQQQQKKKEFAKLSTWLYRLITE